ncbi:helix-turn-helix domain-containing protein [Geobacter sp.]|uniref:helix-turn-helix domain-containing protein n=1 Tax=Geobacter sp. TaxID=46610 RepID=UPI0027BA3377|nr:helix-turn-helix domain-containing protein [Geobacter sp.]
MSLKDIYDVDTNFVHIFSEMFRSGDAKDMGPHTLMVYLAIKIHVNMNNGVAFPSVDTLQEITGVSRSQVFRALKVLEDINYIVKSKHNKVGGGSHNVYKMQEKFIMKDVDGNDTAVATFDYVPSAVRATMAELKNFQMTGEKGNIVRIENLVLNFNNYTNCTINQSNIREAHNNYAKTKRVQKFIESDPKRAEYVSNLAKMTNPA